MEDLPGVQRRKYLMHRLMDSFFGGNCDSRIARMAVREAYGSIYSHKYMMTSSSICSTLCGIRYIRHESFLGVLDRATLDTPSVVGSIKELALTR